MGSNLRYCRDHGPLGGGLVCTVTSLQGMVDSSRLSKSAGKSSIMRVKSSVRLGSPRVTIGNVSVVDIFFT